MNGTDAKERVYWIDIAKAILIVLVVYGHFSQNVSYNQDAIHVLRRHIYSYHIPAFFFLSGFLDSNSNAPIWDRIVHKIRSLLLPGYIGILFSLIYFFVRNGFDYLKDFFRFDNLMKELLWMCDAKATYWFLASLVVVFIMSWAIHEYIPQKELVIVVSFCIFFVGIVLIQVFPLSYLWPFAIIQGMISIPFFEIGRTVKFACSEVEFIPKNGLIVLLTIVIGGVSYIFSVINPFKYNIGVWCAGVGDAHWYFLCALWGVGFIVVLSQLLSRLSHRLSVVKHFIRNIAKNTIYVYVFHGLFIEVIVTIIKIKDLAGAFTDIIVAVGSFLIVAIIAITTEFLKNNIKLIKTRVNHYGK